MTYDELNLDNIKTLEQGHVFKNRRELCDFLGVEYAKSGKAVRTQIERINHIFLYHKEGHKFIIDCVYPDAIIELNFLLSNDRQKQISELLILDLILGAIDNDDEALVINQNVLIPYLALANQNYIYYYYNKNNELAKKLGMKVDHVKTLDTWLSSVRGSLKSAIDSAINQLEKEGYVLHSQVYKVQIVNQDNEILVQERVNDFGDKETEYKSQHSEIRSGIRLATDAETNEILAIEKEVLRDLDMTKQDLILQGQFDKFNRICRNTTIERLGVGFYFLCHKFNFAKGFIEEKKEKIIQQLKNQDIGKLKYELNGLMCDKVRVNSQRRIDRHNEKLESIQSELNKISDDDSKTVVKHQARDLMKSYEKQLGKDYLNTVEHRELEERLVEFLLVINDLNKDVKKVWFDKIKK